MFRRWSSENTAPREYKPISPLKHSAPTIPVTMFRLAWLALALLAGAGIAAAEERILSFHSEIEVDEDGSMMVTETIHVTAENKQINRGIYRDFPTRYTTPRGDNYVVDFDLLHVSRNGNTEPHHTQTTSDGIRIYIGDKNVTLTPGEYEYRLTYYTNRQLGFFSDHDELYWNVTGNDWAFPIDRASARVKLPPTIPFEEIRVEGYTGSRGAQDGNYDAEVTGTGVAEFSTNRGLRKGEGLTIVASWPKGYVREPSVSDKAGYFLRDNKVGVISLIGLGVLLSYYLLVWLKVGRDPETGTIVPLFYPPDDLSPAAMRYIYRMGYDNKAYSAALLNMAVKGYMTIEDHDNTYRLNLVDGADKSLLTTREAKVAWNLFGGKRSTTLEQKNNSSIRKSVKTLKTLLKNEYQSVQFHTNRWYLIPGVLLSLLVLVIAGFSHSGEAAATVMMMSVWLTGWSFGVFMLIRQRQILMACIFVFFEIFALMTFFQVGSWAFLILLGSLIILNALFYYLLQAPTSTGRKLMDRIEGFRLYLATAEEDRLNALNPPEQTPELFEKYLPYALALGVDQAWSERFAARLQRAALSDRRSGYRPDWYRSSNWSSFDPAGFASDLGSSLSSAVSRSSVAPGSSSGGGGGGSSGGGGGGGGGGGW